MRKLLVLVAAIVAVLSLATIAQGTEYESSHVWFFGDCENQYDSPYYDSSVTGASFLGGGCRGIGIFVGDWDSDSIAERVSYEAMDDFGGYWEVDYLKAINLFGGPPVTGTGYGCGSQDPINVTPQGLGGGLWIAIISVVPCEPEICVPPVEDLLAVAYIDNDAEDGGYDPCIDTLIAKLVDVDSSGSATAGDLIATGRYPKDFAAAAVGDFTVRLHTAASHLETTSDLVSVRSTTSDLFVWFHSATVESYGEAPAADGSQTLAFRDSLSPSIGDWLVVDGISPSAPDDDVAETYGSDYFDQAFVDVEIYLAKD